MCLLEGWGGLAFSKTKGHEGGVFSLVEFFPQKGRPLNIIGPPSAREDKVKSKIKNKTLFLNLFFVVVAAAGRTTWPWLPGANIWSNHDDIHPDKTFKPDKITSKKEINISCFSLDFVY